jgi:divalent metal cation (Fe/Co/Zn/Cd) transporter
MTTNKKQKKEVPATVKTIVSLVEVVARFLTAYLLMNNFDHIVAVAVAWYMLVTAAIMFVAVFHKAFKN